MSRLVAVADGNFTSSSVWGVCSAVANAELDAETAQALTTSPLNSANFTPAATAIDAILVKVAARAAGSPSNTITITLRNTTTNADAAAVTINVSDIDTCDSTNKEGGWYCFKFGSTHTPNGTDTYAVRAVLSATTTAVSLWRDGTTNNWARLIRLVTTAAPAAGDRMVIAKEWTAAGTGTARAVTMDNVATTVFGSATGLSTTRGNFINAAICCCKGGTLTWGTTAATAYLLKLTGHIVVYSGGTYTQGGVGTEIPRDSSAIVEFVMTTSQDSRIGILPGCTFDANGLSRTVAKDVYYCLLAANAAASATAITVDRDTGWLNADEVVFASTTRTPSQTEERILSGGAASGSFNITVGLTNAHAGSDVDIAGEVALITRNVQFRSDNAARFTAIEVIGQSSGAGADFTFRMKWASVRYLAGASGPGLSVAPSSSTLGTGSVFDVQYCCFRDYGASGQTCVAFGETGGASTLVFNKNLIVGVTSGSGLGLSRAATTNTVYTINDNLVVTPLGSGMTLSDVQGASASGNRLCATNGNPLVVSETAQLTPGFLDNTIIHGSGGQAISLAFNCFNQTIAGLKLVRNGGTVGNISSNLWGNVIFSNWLLLGNSTTNFLFSQALASDVTFDTCAFCGDTTFSTATGLSFTATSTAVMVFYLRNCVFGSGTGTRTTHTSEDLKFTNLAAGAIRVICVNTTLASATKITTVGTPNPGNWISQQQIGGLAAHSKQYFGVGTVAYETTTTHTSGFAEKLTPTVTVTGGFLRSSPHRVAVDSGDTVSISVWARKDGTFNGATVPRVIVKANPSIGILVDTVLDTLSVGANTWEELTGTTAAASAAGVMEFVVECNGTAGNAFVGEWAAS